MQYFVRVHRKICTVLFLCSDHFPSLDVILLNEGFHFLSSSVEIISLLVLVQAEIEMGVYYVLFYDFFKESKFVAVKSFQTRNITIL